MLKHVTFSRRVPSCTTTEQFTIWKEAARQYSPHAKVGFCEDCTAEYQSKMFSEGRCENPHVWFCLDDDGFEYGTIKHREEEQVNERPSSDG
jgi:hypothetical protein